MLLVYVFSVVDTILVDAYNVALAPIHATSLDDVVVTVTLVACDAARFANLDADASSAAGATNVDVADGATIDVPHTVVIFVVS